MTDNDEKSSTVFTGILVGLLAVILIAVLLAAGGFVVWVVLTAALGMSIAFWKCALIWAGIYILVGGTVMAVTNND